MGFLDALLGRTKPVAANLDRLFRLPGARITLEASESLVPTGQAGVCFKPATGSSFASAEAEIAAILELDDGDGTGAAAGRPVRSRLDERTDGYGYRWVVLDSPDFDNLVTRAHFVNSTLNEHGWGPQLLCSAFGFARGSSEQGAPAPGPASIYVVYLYKRGTFYPFVPVGHERRDNEAELRLKAELSGDLAIEPELDRWFPIWELPVH